MTIPPHFDQKNQYVEAQTNIDHADQVIIHRSCSASGLLVPQQIPPPPLDFTGREGEIKVILNEFDQGATITGLRGMGGVGKTALALILADRLKNRFPDGQIYLNLLGMSKNTLKPEEAMAHIIRSYLGIEAKLPGDQNGLGGLYRSVLSGKRALILLDNAACREQVEPLLPPKDCIVLITARKKFSLPGMPEPFLLESLKSSDARELLLKICPRIGNHAKEIAKLCGYLPLALRAASSLLAVKIDLNPSDYLKELSLERTRLEKIGKEGVDIDVEASLNLSYIRLPAETASIFRQLSVFPSDFDAQAEEFICQDEDHRNLSELITWSLVEFLDSGRYHLHDLVRVFACMRQDNDVSNLQMRHAKYYKDVLSRIDELYIKGERDAVAGREIFDAEWANIRLGQKWAEDAAFLNSGEKESKDLIPEMEPILHLCSAYASEAAYAIGMLLNPRERIHWLETALLASHLLKEPKNECAHLSNIGIAHIQVGEFHKAIDVFEKRLSLSRKIGDLLGVSNAVANLGVAYLAIGDTYRAIELFKQHLNFVRLNSDRRGEAKDLGNLGLAYADLNKPQEAIDYCEQALKIFRDIMDPEGEGAALGNLGLAYSKLGQINKAIEYFEKQLAIASNIGDRWGKRKALINLGNSYADEGKNSEAIEYYKNALELIQQAEDRKEEANILENLGCTYYDSGNYFKAIDCYKQALIIARKIGNKELEENNLNFLAGAHYALGDYSKAIDYYELALTAVHMIGNRQEEENIMGNLGNSYALLDITMKSIEFYEKALSIAREIKDWHGEGNGLFNLSLSWNKLGQQDKAIFLARSALAIFEKIESPHVEIVRKKLAEWGA